MGKSFAATDKGSTCLLIESDIINISAKSNLTDQDVSYD